MVPRTLERQNKNSCHCRELNIPRPSACGVVAISTDYPFSVVLCSHVANELERSERSEGCYILCF